MKVGALIYVRPADWDCLLYKQVTPQGKQKYTFADAADAQKYADEHNLEAVHDVVQTTK